MTIEVCKEAIELIQHFEGCVLDAYQDERGIWTIGWGHTGPEVVQGKRITQIQADVIFHTDLSNVAIGIESVLKVILSPNQFGAVCSLVYNIGIDAFRNSTLLKFINASNKEGVPSQFAVWNKILKNGKLEVSLGLVKRRAMEIGLWLKDDTNTFSRVVSSVTPEKPKMTPLLYTKTIIGLGLASLARGIDFLTGFNFTDAASQINQFSDLGPLIHRITFFLTVLGLGMAFYGRTKNRVKTGV